MAATPAPTPSPAAIGLSTIDGLPAHILIVHAVVVLVPLSAIAHRRDQADRRPAARLVAAAARCRGLRLGARGDERRRLAREPRAGQRAGARSHEDRGAAVAVVRCGAAAEHRAVARQRSQEIREGCAVASEGDQRRRDGHRRHRRGAVRPGRGRVGRAGGADRRLGVKGVLAGPLQPCVDAVRIARLKRLSPSGDASSSASASARWPGSSGAAS